MNQPDCLSYSIDDVKYYHDSTNSQEIHLSRKSVGYFLKKNSFHFLKLSVGKVVERAIVKATRYQGKNQTSLTNHRKAIKIRKYSAMGILENRG